MSNARNLSRLIVDSGGDVEVSSLGNVPPSNDASALTTGTLPVGRLPSSGVDASSLTTGTLGTARLPAGSVIQVVNTTYTETFSQAVSYNTKINNVQASITPTNTSSKILIMCHVFFEGSTHDHDLGWFLYRDSTLLRAPAAGSRVPLISMAGVGYHGDDQSSTPTTVAIHYFDTPNTTSAITYSPGTYNTAATVYINRTVGDGNSGGFERGISSITLMEIAG